MAARLRELRYYLRAVLLLIFVGACGRSSGCDGCPAGEPFPDKDKVHSAVQLRVTEGGLNFLEENLEPLLAQALPDGLAFCLPGQQGNVPLLGIGYGFCHQEACVDDPNAVGCNLGIEIGNVDLQAVEPDVIRASLTFNELAVELPVFAEGIIECAVLIDAPGFPVSIDLLMSTPEPQRNLFLELQGVEYRLADLNIRLESNGGGFLSPVCDAISGLLDLPFIGDFIWDTLQGFVDGILVDQLNGFVNGFLCMQCESDLDCPGEGGGRCDGGTCMVEDHCIPAPLGLEGELDVGAILGGVSPGLEAVVQYLAAAGSYAEVEQAGLSIGMISGAIAEQNRCVPRRAQPPTDEPPRAVALRTNLDPQGRQYEVGIGVTETVLRHFMYAFYTSGALCLGITGDALSSGEGGGVNFLSAGVLGAALGLRSLTQLTGPSAPMAITLQPQEVPIAVIGANTVMPDPDNEGQFIFDEPLLTLQIPDLWLDFHAFFNDRWVRVISIQTDVEIGLGLAFDPDNGIIPVLGDLSTALRNVEVANDEILIDDTSGIPGALPMLIGLASGILTDSLSDPIALPDIMGFQLDLQDGSVTGIEENTVLAIFANLERSEMVNEGMGAAYTVQTTAEVLKLHVPPAEKMVGDAIDAWKRPFVRVAVEGHDGTTDEAEMEYQWNVDGYGWSLFSPASAMPLSEDQGREMVIRSPAFLRQGWHTIRVRGRRVDDYRSLDPDPAELRVLIDAMAPSLTGELKDGALKVEVSDLISPADKITLEYKVGEQPWRVGDERFVPEAPGLIAVRATDEAGNQAEMAVSVSQSALIGRGSWESRHGEGGEEGGCGSCMCSVSEDERGAPWGLLLALPVVLLGLRRRRLGLVLALFVGLLGGCDDNSKGKDGDDPQVDASVPEGCESAAECGVNEMCVDGNCQVITCKEDPRICESLECESGEPAICNNMNVCECTPFCADGCGDDEYCCLARNECAETPDACAGMDCPVGHELMVSEGGEINPATCELEDAQCDCVELPPIDPGTIGLYSDFVEVGGSAWASAYNEGKGDLVVGKWLGEVEGWAWDWVDGLPEDGDIEGAPSGPRGGVTDRGPNVGQYTAIAAGPDGFLHVAYYDVDNLALKYALGSPMGEGYTWRTLTLDTEGDAGRWASISVDDRGVPGIAYRVGSVPAEEMSFQSELRYLLAKNATPGNPEDWNEAFILHTRALEAEDPNTDTYPEGTGLFTAQARDAAGLPVVAWYDRSFGQLWSTRMVDAGFAEPEMLAGWGHETRDGDMGTNVEVAIDGEGNLHLCFQDGLRDALRYISPALDRDDEVDDGVRVDADGREHAVHIVGEDCSMVFGLTGDPVIVYQDATGHDLLVARRDGQGNWSRVAVRGAENMYRGAFGFWARARAVGEQLWITNFVYRNHEEEPHGALELVIEDL